MKRYREIVLGLQRDYVEAMRNSTAPQNVTRAGLDLVVLPGAFPPYLDSEMIIQHLSLKPTDTALDVGTGSGIIALWMASRVERVVATDISPAAIDTVRLNAERLGLTEKLSAFEADLFPPPEAGPFDIVTFNSPFSDHPADDVAGRSVWDPGHATVKRFFSEIGAWLRPGGRLYFSWADFADFAFIEALMTEAGFRFKRVGEATDDVSAWAVYELHREGGEVQPATDADL